MLGVAGQSVSKDAASQITVNATSAKVNGLDFDATYRASQHLNFNFSFGYLDSTYSDFPNAPCTRRTATGMTHQYECDVTGNTTTHAPKVTFDVGASYGVPTSVGLFTLSTNHAYTSQIVFSRPMTGFLNPPMDCSIANSSGHQTLEIGAWLCMARIF
jgi:outer membrane receptor protein involved in Fe transport